jgi:hypothetical protein
MVIASAALLNNTGRPLMVSLKMMIVLNSLTSLNNECFLPTRVRVTASHAIKTEDQNLDYMNLKHIGNHSMAKMHVILGPGTMEALTILE